MAPSGAEPWLAWLAIPSARASGSGSWRLSPPGPVRPDVAGPDHLNSPRGSWREQHTRVDKLAGGGFA